MYEVKCYKIWYDDEPEEFYIGSTKLNLSQRMVGHRSCARNDSNYIIHQKMREKGINEFQYVQLGSCMVSNKDEQMMFEQQYITSLKPTLNKIRSHSTPEERKLFQRIHHEKNKESINARHRDYYTHNREHIIAKTTAYKATRPEFFKEYRKQHHLQNIDKDHQNAKLYRERTKDKRTCICGEVYNYGSKYNRERHYRSKTHTNHVKLIYEKLFNIYN